MNRYLARELLERAKEHTTYILTKNKDMYTQGYIQLAKKGYLIKHRISQTQPLYQFKISRRGMQELNQLTSQAKSDDKAPKSIKSLTTESIAWISLALGIATCITTMMFNIPNQSSGFIMLGIYAFIILGCIVIG